MKVIGLQWNIQWEDPCANFEHVERLLSQQAQVSGALVVLPEMFTTGFSMNTETVCEAPEGRTESWLSDMSRRHECCLVAGVAVRGVHGKGRNQMLAYLPDGSLAMRYTKIHPFSYGKETDHYERGDQVESFEFAGFRIAPFICYDLRFPEIFRVAAQQGTDLFLVIANWPIMREWHWVRLLEARAIENLAYAVGINRCGQDPFLTYPGRSLIIDPLGKILADAGDQEGVIQAELELSQVRNWQSEFPALRDRHPKFVGGN